MSESRGPELDAAPPGVILSWFPSSLPVAMAMHYQAADLLPCGMFALSVGAGR